MATITGITAAKMQEYIDANVVSGSVNPMGNLILVTHDGTEIDAGGVMDPLLPGTDSQYYRGDKTWQTLYNGAVGLGNVDNTSDLNKPISTAQVTKNTDYDKMAKGLLYRQTVATSSPSISSAVVNNIPTYTFKAGRKYRIVWDFSHHQGDAGALFFWDIVLTLTTDAASSMTSLTNLGGRTKGVGGSGVNVTQHTGPITGYFEPTVDTTRQIKFRGQRVFGTSTAVAVGNDNERATYLVYDDGAQAVVIV